MNPYYPPFLICFVCRYRDIGRVRMYQDASEVGITYIKVYGLACVFNALWSTALYILHSPTARPVEEPRRGSSLEARLLVVSSRTGSATAGPKKGTELCKGACKIGGASYHHLSEVFASAKVSVELQLASTLTRSLRKRQS
jgi:hypothetical protein